MARVEASVDIPAPLADVWDLYFDPQRWASWVDGFAALVSEHGYPEAGGSSPGGRRRRVAARSGRPCWPTSRVRCTGSAMRIRSRAGELETTFEMLPGADPRMTRVSQRLTYGLLGGGPLGAVTDFLFIRSQMRRSLERSLSDLRLEAGDGG